MAEFRDISRDVILLFVLISNDKLKESRCHDKNNIGCIKENLKE